MRDWLTSLRKSLNLRQEDVSDAIGVSQVAYCQYELGDRRPSPEVAKKIAAVLGFDWTRFYEDG